MMTMATSIVAHIDNMLTPTILELAGIGLIVVSSFLLIIFKRR